MDQALAGRRVLIVGASTGIGRATALVLSGAGARVAIAARRAELLEKTVAEAPSEAIPLACDVREPEACDRVVADTVAAFGGLDAIVYAAGTAVLTPLASASAEQWRSVLETNLVGAALVTRAAMPHLAAGNGHAIYLSSSSASLTSPWPGLGLYVVSKAGLDKLVEAWRVEHPEVSFTRIIVGPTMGTDFASGWDPAVAQEHVGRWVQMGYMTGSVMQPESIGHHVVGILSNPERVWSVTLHPA